MSTNLMAGRSARVLKFFELFRYPSHHAASTFRFLQSASAVPKSHIDSRLRAFVMKVKDDFDQLVTNSRNNSTLFRHLQPKEIKTLADISDRLEQAENEMAEIIAMENGADTELLKMIKEESERIIETQKTLEEKVVDILLTENNAVDGIIMELSAGVGGQESMLFCNELLEMYCGFCDSQGWDYTITSCETTELEGVRHAAVSIDHPGAYNKLKYEGGVHRVQRVPKTEKAGRIHTSTASVVILPKPSPVTVVIDPKDLKIETKRASGAGGQHVNTTESAVRITHIPSGLVMECQTQRSQIQNRTVALENLRARLYQMELDKQLILTKSTRKLQVSSSARSEKIRTYNFAQDRVTDHRINFSSHNIIELMRGTRPLEVLLARLEEESRKERLEELLDQIERL